jgi:hypothetical protein
LRAFLIAHQVFSPANIIGSYPTSFVPDTNLTRAQKWQMAGRGHCSTHVQGCCLIQIGNKANHWPDREWRRLRGIRLLWKGNNSVWVFRTWFSQRNKLSFIIPCRRSPRNLGIIVNVTPGALSMLRFPDHRKTAKLELAWRAPLAGCYGPISALLTESFWARGRTPQCHNEC